MNFKTIIHATLASVLFASSIRANHNLDTHIILINDLKSLAQTGHVQQQVYGKFQDVTWVKADFDLAHKSNGLGIAIRRNSPTSYEISHEAVPAPQGMAEKVGAWFGMYASAGDTTTITLSDPNNLEPLITKINAIITAFKVPFQ